MRCGSCTDSCLRQEPEAIAALETRIEVPPTVHELLARIAGGQR